MRENLQVRIDKIRENCQKVLKLDIEDLIN